MNSTVQAIAERIFTSEEVKGIAADLIRLALKPEVKAGALYTYVEVSTLLNIGYSTVKRAVENERLKTNYVGSEPRIRGAAILQWLDEGGKTGRSKRNLIEEAV
jgi:excisionase family DNA binding protein